KLRQSAEIAADFCAPLVGGRRAAEQIAIEAGSPANGGALVLLGHSAGGVAAVHAAAKLDKLGYRIGAVAMIGSPKTPIPKPIRERTAWFSACNAKGRRVDAIARLGGWLGKPPGRIQPLSIVGG